MEGLAKFGAIVTLLMIIGGFIFTIMLIALPFYVAAINGKLRELLKVNDELLKTLNRIDVNDRIDVNAAVYFTKDVEPGKE